MRNHLNAAIAAAILATLSACAPSPAPAAPAVEAPAAAPIPYGANAAASGTFAHDGVTFYYETYGEGEPLLLVHGNGASIGSFAKQIEHFKLHYRVIAMDSREQGKSTGSDAPLTYEVMTDDLAALIDHLKTGPVNVLGWSDGGIEGLLLGIRHPDKVKKIVAMAANLNPSLEALYPETLGMVDEMKKSVPPEAASTPEGKRALKLMQLMLDEPNIAPAALGKIAAPTLVLAGDQDLIRLEHTVAIFNAIPNAELAIFPNSTHAVPLDSPELFNATVDSFLSRPFKKKTRVGDMLASFGGLLTTTDSPQ
jgi:pimeloyl-ACP methyl ester carboxylesterase